MIRAVKGTRDILPPASDLWNAVEQKTREVFRAYNYHEIRTPIFEETLLFARGVGEETDIVTKEMYTFEDRDGASLTLRPGVYGFGDPGRHRTPARPAAGPAEALLHGTDVPARAAAERAFPAVLPDRRGSDRIANRRPWTPR